MPQIDEVPVIDEVPSTTPRASTPAPTTLIDEVPNVGANVSDHVQLYNEARGRSQAIDEIVGAPHNVDDAHLTAQTVARSGVPLDPSSQAIADFFTTPPASEPSKINLSFGPNALDRARAQQKALDKKLLAKFMDEQTQFGEGAPGGVYTGPDFASIARTQRALKGQATTLDKISLGLEEGQVGVLLSPIRVAQALRSFGQQIMGHKVMMAMPKDEARPSTATYEHDSGYGITSLKPESLAATGNFTVDENLNYLDQLGKFADEQLQTPLQPSQQTFMYQLSKSVGSLPMLMLGSTMLGRYGMAAYLTLQNGQSAEQVATAQALHEGYPPSVAKEIGQITAVRTLPLSFMLQLWNPLSRMGEPGVVGNNFTSRMFYGGLQNTIIGGVQTGVNFVNDPGYQDPVSKQFYGMTLHGAGTDAAVNFLTGAAIGVATPKERVSLEQALKKIRVAPDVLNGQELFKFVEQQYEQPGGIGDRSTLKSAVDLLDSVINESVRRNGGTVESAYANTIGNLKLPDTPQEKASLILTDRGQRLFDALSKGGPEAFRETALLMRDGFMAKDDLATVEKLFGVKAPDAKQAEAEQTRQGLLAMRDQITDPTKRLMVNALVDSFDAEQPSGTSGSRWTPEQDTRFGQAFEAYLREGKAPTPELQDVFDQSRQALKTSANRAATLGFRLKGEQLSSALDRMFVEDSDPVKAQRQRVAESELALQVAKEDLSSLVDKAQGEMPKGKAQLEREAELVRAKAELDAQREALAQAQRQNFSPKEPTRQELQALQAKTMFEGLTGDARSNVVVRAVRGAARGVLSSFGQITDKLGSSPLAQATKDFLNGAAFDRMRMDGDLHLARDTALKLIGRSDNERLGAIDENGWSNIRKLIEPDFYGKNEVSNNADMVALELFKQVFKWQTQGMTDNDFYRRMTNGNVLPAQPSDKLLMPRVPTMVAHDIASGRGGEMTLKYLDNVRKVPGQENITADDLMLEMQKQGTGPMKGTMGSMEGSRKLWLPDGFHDSFGRQINVFATHPGEFFVNLIHRAASRLAIVKVGGQNLLSNVADPTTVSFYNRWLKLTDIFGQKPDFSKQALQERLIDYGEDRAEVLGKSYDDLVQMSKNRDLPTQATIEDLVNISRTLDAKNLNAEQRQKLRDMADEVGGIASRGDPQVVLEQLRHRMSFEVADDIIDQWRTKWADAHGETKRFDDVMNAWHGHFGGDEFSLRGPLPKAVDILANSVGGLMTTFASLKHAFQFPKMAAIVGVKSPQDLVRYIVEPLLRGTFDKKNVSVEVAPFKLLSDLGWANRSRTESMLVNTFRNFRSAMAKGSLMAPMMEWNENMFALMGRAIADDWINKGFKDDQKGLALRFGLNEGDIAMLKDRGVKVPLGRPEVATTLDEMARIIKEEPAPEAHTVIPLNDAGWEALYGKIVRGAMGFGLGAEWTHPQNRSAIETNPYARRLLGFQKWAGTMFRAMESTFKDFDSGIKSRDPQMLASAGGRLLTFVGVGLGVGMLQHLLVKAMKARPPEEDSSWMDSAKGAVVESMIFGTPMNMFNNFRFSQGNAERMVLGWAPQVNALVKLVQVVLGMGKWGNAPMATRAARAIEDLTPALKGFEQHWENETYPLVAEWNSSRSLYRKWEEAQPGYEPTGGFNAPIDIPKYEVFKAVQRGDVSAAQVAFKDYMDHEIAKGDRTKFPKDFVESLKISLMDRRPVPLTGLKWDQFITSLPPEQRQRIIAAQNRYVGTVNILIPPKAHR